MPADDAAERIALALMGVGDLPASLLAESAVWERSRKQTAVGREAILAARADATEPEAIELSEVVTHGRAGSVTGRVMREGRAHLFCHVIRFANASAGQIVQMVSIEQPEHRP